MGGRASRGTAQCAQQRHDEILDIRRVSRRDAVPRSDARIALPSYTCRTARPFVNGVAIHIPRAFKAAPLERVDTALDCLGRWPLMLQTPGPGSPCPQSLVNKMHPGRHVVEVAERSCPSQYLCLVSDVPPPAVVSASLRPPIMALLNAAAFKVALKVVLFQSPV